MGLRYPPKCVSNSLTKPNQTINLWHLSEDISAPQARINLRIASLERCFKAGHFEYNKAYILEFRFFGLKGGRVDFKVKMLIPKTDFFSLPILTSILDYLYMKPLIFT